MMTIQVELPDMLAQSAQAAGLLTPQALEAMLREQLKRQSGGTLRAVWASAPPEELTPEIERMIDEQVQAVRARRCTQAAHYKTCHLELFDCQNAMRWVSRA